MQADELLSLADEKGAVLWKSGGMVIQGYVLALTGKAADAVRMITSGIGCIAVNGSNIVDAVVACHIWPGPMRNLANSMMLGAALTKR